MNTQIEECLVTWGVSILEEWDLLVFLHRHRNVLLTVEQISLLLGYDKSAVNKALKQFEAAGLVRRSRSSKGICFSQLVASVDTARQGSFELLVNLFNKPSMRHLVARRLPSPLPARGGLRRAGLYLT